MSPAGISVGKDGRARCWWCGEDEPYLSYHDDEWGQPVTDDHRLFEKICLEGFQSGLSWLIILRKRENFRKAFANFDFQKVSRFDAKRVEKLMGDAGIVRHRGKIESTINNAKRALELSREFGSLAKYFWSFEPKADARPKRMTQAVLRTLGKTDASLGLSRDLKKRGWSFVGPTTVYAFMQVMGMVNDHLEGCAGRERTEKLRQKLRRP